MEQRKKELKIQLIINKILYKNKKIEKDTYEEIEEKIEKELYNQKNKVDKEDREKFDYI